MGLDMNLLKKRKGLNSKPDWDNELAYWRKANQIHRWFVTNVQNGNDDCGYYEVSKEQIKELYEICKEVAKKTKLKNGEIIKGYTFSKNNGKEPIIVEAKIIVNPEVAEELLPTNSGFFFGSTEYDEYYLDDVKYTEKTLKEILDKFDFDNYSIVYTSSW